MRQLDAKFKVCSSIRSTRDIGRSQNLEVDYVIYTTFSFPKFYNLHRLRFNLFDILVKVYGDSYIGLREIRYHMRDLRSKSEEDWTKM